MSHLIYEFEWDPEKARVNRKDHGIDFEEAETVFDDPYARIIDDPDHSVEEHREIIIGYSGRNHLLFVSFTERSPNLIRIISARRANSKERKGYEEEYSEK
ncbi:MAG: BrnT family toxin [Acidobacteriota bacterium]